MYDDALWWCTSKSREARLKHVMSIRLTKGAASISPCLCIGHFSKTKNVMTEENDQLRLRFAIVPYSGRRRAAFCFPYDCDIPLLKCYYGMRCILKLHELMLAALFTAARLASVDPTFNPNEKANNMHVFIPAGKFTSWAYRILVKPCILTCFLIIHSSFLTPLFALFLFGGCRSLLGRHLVRCCLFLLLLF